MPRRLSLLLLLPLLLVAPPAQAQPADAGPQAAQAFAEGTEAYRRGDYPAAVAAFTRSYRLQPQFLTLCNIARCHEHTGRLLQASTFYRRCLAEGGVTSPKAAQIVQAMRAVEAQLGRLSIRASHGIATAVVDGKVVGKTPTQVVVEPGPHQVHLQRDEASSNLITVEARVGKEQTVVLELPEVPAAASQPEPREQPRPPTRKKLHAAWLWATVAVTVAFGVTSGVLGAKTMDANRDYEARPTKEGYDRVILRRDLTNAFFGLALGGVVASGVLLYFNRFGITVDTHEEAGAAGRRYDVIVTGGGRF